MKRLRCFRRHHHFHLIDTLLWNTGPALPCEQTQKKHAWECCCCGKIKFTYTKTGKDWYRNV